VFFYQTTQTPGRGNTVMSRWRNNPKYRCQVSMCQSYSFVSTRKQSPPRQDLSPLYVVTNLRYTTYHNIIINITPTIDVINNVRIGLCNDSPITLNVTSHSYTQRSGNRSPTIHIILYQPLRFWIRHKNTKNPRILNGVVCIEAPKIGERPYQHPLNYFSRTSIFIKFIIINHKISTI